MRLTTDDATARLVSHDHGVLATVHTTRGVDAVPCVFAVDSDGFVGVPIDRVKPKSSSRLQREHNLESDSRATLLVVHWDSDDWSRLWWVRASLRWESHPPPAREAGLAALLADRFVQYRDRPFDRVVVLRILDVTGWAADQGPDPTVD